MEHLCQSVYVIDMRVINQVIDNYNLCTYYVSISSTHQDYFLSCILESLLYLIKK